MKKAKFYNVTDSENKVEMIMVIGDEEAIVNYSIQLITHGYKVPDDFEDGLGKGDVGKFIGLLIDKRKNVQLINGDKVVSIFFDSKLTKVEQETGEFKSGFDDNEKELEIADLATAKFITFKQDLFNKGTENQKSYLYHMGSWNSVHKLWKKLYGLNNIEDYFILCGYNEDVAKTDSTKIYMLQMDINPNCNVYDDDVNMVISIFESDYFIKMILEDTKMAVLESSSIYKKKPR